MMIRHVEPEILDSLDPHSPIAAACRRDLRSINALMGNPSWFCAELRQLVRPNDQLLELGAGTGDLAVKLWPKIQKSARIQQERLPGYLWGTCIPWPAPAGAPGSLAPELALATELIDLDMHCYPGEVCLTGLDLLPRPLSWPECWGWIRMDINDFEDFKDFEGVLGNLILHHLSDQQLRVLGRKLVRGPRFLLFNEPARRPIHLWQARSTRLLGMCQETIHDAQVSVRAGFLAQELPSLLELDTTRWHIRIQTTWLGAYRMCAVRR